MVKPAKTFPKIVVILLVIITVFVSCFPLFWMLSSSLKPYDEAYSSPPNLLPKKPTIANYFDLFRLTNFATYFWNSTIVAVGATILAVTFSVLSGYALSRSNTWFARWFGRLVLFTYIFPPILMLIPLYMLITNIGLGDNRLGLTLTYVTFTLPFTVWLIKSFFDAVPQTFEEAALVDGATSFQIYWRIVLPIARPGIISTAIFAFIEAWNEYLYAVVFIFSDTKKNLAAGVSSLLGETAIYSWGMLMAAAAVITIPLIIVFPFLQRHLIAGFGEGGIKG